jgi:hypothetical protein
MSVPRREVMTPPSGGVFEICWHISGTSGCEVEPKGVHFVRIAVLSGHIAVSNKLQIRPEHTAETRIGIE